MRIICCLIALLYGIAIGAQPVFSDKLKEGKMPEGTVYYLPKTALNFHLLLEKTVYKPGIFSPYAVRFLHRTDISQEAKTEHRLINFQLSQTGVRDTSKCFIVHLKGKVAAATNINLNEEGILMAVNDTPMVVPKHQPFHAAPKHTPKDPMQLLTTETLTAGSMARMAELTALQMAELQEHRQLLITGEAEEMPSDMRQLQLMLQEIDQTYESLLTLFAGTTIRDTTEHTFTICPDKEMNHEVLFRVNKQLGFVDKDDLSGIPFYLTLEDLHQQSQQQYDFPENKKDGGFYTNVPGIVRLTLYQENRQLATYDYPFAQFGFTELRSGSLFKRYPTHLRLNPITGAVEKLKAEIPDK